MGIDRLNRPDFHGLHNYAKARTPKGRGPQAVLPHERLYRCECCNDTGIAQEWKLNKWAFPDEEPLDHNSTPIFCCQFQTCGDLTMTVFAADRDQTDGKSRTETMNLFNTPSGESTRTGTMLGQGRLKVLSQQQSRYIHNKVLEYRQQLSEGPGKEWVEEIKRRCRGAMPETAERGDGGLTKVCVEVELPVEPTFKGASAPVVEIASSRDFAAVSVGHTPAQPDGPLTLEQEPETPFVPF